MSRLDELIQELCPEGVEYKEFGKVATIVRGASPRPISNFITASDDGVNWIKIGDVKPDSKYIESTKEKITLEGAKKSRMVLPGDFILSNSMSFGRPYIMKISGCIHDGWLSISDYEDIYLTDFLYYLLNSSDLQGQMKQKASQGGSIQNLNADIVKALEVPVPPLEVQREIVRVLDNFTLLRQELSAELSARRKQYEYYRDELIENAVGEKGKLIDLLSQPITDGPHTTPKFVDEGIPFISATALYDGAIHLEDAQGFISKEFDAECAKKYKPRKNDIYMVKSGSTTGKVAFVDTDEDFNIWSPLAAMRTDNYITARYVYHVLQTSWAQFLVQTRMSHGSQPNLSMRVLEQFDVKVPTLEEQEKIINVLDRFDVLCNDISSGLPAEIEARTKQYEYYRDKLLSFPRKETA